MNVWRAIASAVVVLTLVATSSAQAKLTLTIAQITALNPRIVVPGHARSGSNP